jgi:hypothetical protein
MVYKNSTVWVTHSLENDGMKEIQSWLSWPITTVTTLSTGLEVWK